MSLQTPDLAVSNTQTFNTVQIRLHDDISYICKVEEDGSIIHGAELVVDALPPAVLMGLAGSATNEVLQSVLTLSGIII